MRAFALYKIALSLATTGKVGDSGSRNNVQRFLVDLENGKKTAQIGKVIDVCNALGIVIDMKSPFEKIYEVDVE